MLHIPITPRRIAPYVIGGATRVHILVRIKRKANTGDIAAIHGLVKRLNDAVRRGIEKEDTPTSFEIRVRELVAKNGSRRN